MYRRVLILLCLVFILMACSKPASTLPPEKRTQLEQQAEKLEAKIQAFKPNKKTQIPEQELVDLALVYQNLAQPKKAIKVYEKGIEKGYKSMVIYNNLGRLYEEVGAYEKAVKTYQRIIDEYFDDHYLYDITSAYIQAKDYERAQAAYEKWKKAFNSTDPSLEQGLEEIHSK